jgi:intracellular multiplication protein IcmE
LKAAGFSAAELKAAGFSAKDLKDAGFSADELRAAGFSAKDLKAAGFSAADLVAAGFTPEELAAAGFSDEELAQAGIDPDMIGPSDDDLLYTDHQDDKQAQIIDKLQKMQQDAMTQQEQSARMNQFTSGMQSQANSLMSSWMPPPTQSIVKGIHADDDGSIPSASSALGGTSGQQVVLADGTITQKFVSNMAKPVAKAGDIMFAVLETAINSDEDSPILATIVQGPLKGSKLLGGFKRQDKRVVLSFGTISIPSQPRSMSVRTVAIDQSTARTALATSVDNHYWERYGLMFASSFLSGLSDAITQSGSAVAISPPESGGFSVSKTFGTLNSDQKSLVALGKVGTTFSEDIDKFTKTTPTVKVAAGTGIGILFMSDFTVQNS